jgi:hypothetical protein
MTTAEALDVARQLIARLRNRGGGKIGFDELDLDAADALSALVIQVEADAVARERAARLLELSPPELRLLAGEMTAQEMRTVQAVLRNRAAVIRHGDA